MLSQSRKKLKWSHDPQNTFWTNDTTAYGHKMLKKMGWEKGKGLGLKEDGVAEPIKLSANKTKQGLGCTGYDNTWVDHQDDFSAILSGLNNDFPTCKSNGSTSRSEIVSLEKTSQGQKRLHYKKFTKGKDLSNYNQSDMNAIFGLRSQSLPSTPLHGSDDDSDNDEISMLPIKKKKSSKTSKKLAESTQEPPLLIPADCSVTDYFKMKLEKLKQQRTFNNVDLTCSAESASCNNNSDEKIDDQVSKNLNGDCFNFKLSDIKDSNALVHRDSDVHKGIKRKKKSKKVKSKKNKKYQD